MRLAWILFAVAGLAACAGPGHKLGEPQQFTVGDERVVVVASHVLWRSYPTVQEFAQAAPVIVLATVGSTNTLAAEVQPPPDAEGAFPGEGPDLYGTITFRVIEVLKGAAVEHLRIVYQSGKRDGDDPKRRIAYRYEGLTPFQLPDGQLRSAAELAGRTFMVFAAPNTEYPAFRSDHVRFHDQGIAEIGAGGLLQFVNPEEGPVLPLLGPPGPVRISDVRAATGAAPTN
jgi:hypothetical protein